MSETHPLQALFDRAVAIAPFKISSSEGELLRNTYSVRSETIQIVHFIGYDYFLSFLQAGALRVKRLDLYEPFDGVYPAENLRVGSSIDQQIEAAIPIVKDRQAACDSQLGARTFAYIHCWYEGSPRDSKMWASDYSHDGKAVCISTNTQGLQTAMGESPVHLHGELGRCTYRDENEAIPEAFGVAACFRKLRKYEWEKEIRLLFRVKPDCVPKGVPAPESESIPIDISELVESLVLGPNLSPDEVGAIIEAASPLIPPSRISPLRA